MLDKIEKIIYTSSSFLIVLGIVYLATNYGTKAIDSFFDWRNRRIVQSEVNRINEAIGKNEPPYPDGQLYFPFMKDHIKL